MASTNPLSSAFSPRACGALSSSCLLTINDRQQWPLSNDADITRDHSNPAEFPPGCNSPAFGGKLRDRALNGALPVFHSLQAFGANRSSANSLPNQHISQAVADRLHNQVLSNSLASMPQHGAKGKGRVPNSTGELHRSKGEFPNVGS